MIFECFDHLTQQEWAGSLELIVTKEDLYELIIASGSSSFHVIIAKHSYGAIICIPHIGVCCELAALSDIFLNQESLSHHINDSDAITISTAISHLPEFYDYD